MVVTVVVTGMPRLMSLKDLAVELNEVLEGDELGDFRIRDVITNNKTAKRQVALDFESGFDAMTVQQKLDGFEFITSGGSCQVIRAKILTGNVEAEPVPCTEVVISTTSKPDYFEREHDPLEMRIDLLRKKTLALKAQRKFLREQKKLKKEYTSMDVDSDSDKSGTKKSRKRKRKRIKSPNSDSSGNDDRSKSRDKRSSTRSPDRNKKSKSQACEDYVAIEFKKISSTRKSMSPEIRKRSRSGARSKSREKPSRKSEAYAMKSRSRSPNKYKKSSSSRQSNSPSTNDRRRDRSRNSELHKTRSRSREKYYSVEMIQYKKSLVTRNRSPISRGRYESTEQCVMRSKSSKLRSPSPYKSSRRHTSPSPHRRDLPSDTRRRKTPRSKSRSNSPLKRKMRALESIDHRLKNRLPSLEIITTSKISSSKSEYPSEMLESKRNTSKSTDKECEDRDVLIKSDAEIQSKKRQAMEDILFEMELLLRKEKDTISNADKAFLTNLVKGIIGTRFQKLEVHSRMMVSDVVMRYRSQYSREDDKSLLRNLAGECKSLDASTSIVPAQQPDSTAEVVAPPSQNDDWLAAVDEVLDGVDLDLLQGETETNEVSRENSKRESLNSETEDTNTDSVRVTPKKDTTKVVKEKDKLKCGHLSDDTNNSNEDITSSGITMTNSNNLIQKRTIDLAEVSSEKTLNANCNKAPTDGINTKVGNCVKKEPIELSDSSDNEIDYEQTNVTSTVTPEPTSTDTSWAGNIVQVVSLGKTEKVQQSNITASVKKEKFATIDLTDDIELNDDQANTDLPVANLHNVKEEPDTTNNKDLTTEFDATIISCIKQEKIYTIDLIDDDDDIDTKGGPEVLRSIKQEKLATDDDLQNKESTSTPMIPLCAIKQEFETTMNEVNSYSKQVENLFANAQTLFNLGSIKQEYEATETNIESSIENSNMSLNAVISVPISSIKQENIETTDFNCHLETNGGSNDETNIPIPINSDCIKHECDATDNDTNNASDINNISDINNDEISMPIPFALSYIKQEVDTIITNSTSLTKELADDINNDTDKINMPKPIISRSIKQEIATVCDNVNPSEISDEKITPSSKKPKNKKFDDKENSVVANNETVHNVRIDTKDDQSDIPQPIIKSIKKEHLADEGDLKSRRKKYRKRKHNDDCNPEATLSILPSKTKKTSPNRTGKNYNGDKEKGSETCKVINSINDISDRQSDIPIPMPMVESIKKEHKSRDKSSSKKDRKEKHKVYTPENSLSSSSKTKEKADRRSKDNNNGDYDQSSIPKPIIEYVKKENNSADIKDRKRKHIDCTTETSHSSPYKTKERADRTHDHKSSSKKDRKEKHDVYTPETTHPRSYSKEKKDRTKSKDGEKETVTETVSCNTEQIEEISDRTVPANPKFVLPTLVVMRPMKRLLKNEFKDHKYIFHITLKVLNNRFKELLKGKGYVKAKHIIKMYKDHYADEKNEDLLNGIAADIDAGKYEEDIKNIVIKQQINEKEKNKYILEANK